MSFLINVHNFSAVFYRFYCLVFILLLLTSTYFVFLCFSQVVFFKFQVSIVACVQENYRFLYIGFSSYTLLNSLILIFCIFLKIFFYINYHVIWLKNTFTSAFLICMPFVYFSCFTALTRTSIQCWIEVVRAYILDLFPVLGEKHLALCP